MIAKRPVRGRVSAIAGARGSRAEAVATRRAFGSARAGTEAGTKLIAAAALAGCVATALEHFVHFDVPLRMGGALLLLCLAPGAALVSALSGRRVRLELGLVVAASLSVTVLASEAMLLTRLWYPGAAALALAAVSAPFLVAQLLRRGERPARPSAAEVVLAPAGPRRGGLLLWLLSLAAGVGLWLAAIRHVDPTRISGYGLLPALPATYYLALALVAVAFVVALARTWFVDAAAGAAFVAFVVMVHGTPALAYDEPRYTWMYKHLGLIASIGTHGSVDRASDIYSNWPGFFAANAMLVHVGGLTAMRYAAWAQVFFELANAAVLLFALRGLTRDRRVQWAALWLFLLGNWIGQDYLAPQAFGFVATLAVLGLCLRFAPDPRAYRNRLEQLVDGWTARIAGPRRQLEALLPLEEAGSQLPTAAAAVAGALCSVAVVVSHQLSPMMLLVSLAVFSVVTRRIRLSLVAGLALLECVWVALAWPYLHRHFALVHLDLFPHPHPSGANGARAEAGLAFVTWASRALVGLFALLGFAGMLRQRRVGRVQPFAVALAFAPLLLVVFQSYGGEIFLRAYLFALPWLAFFAATIIVSARTPEEQGSLAPGAAWRLAAVTAVAGAAFLVAYFGLEQVNYVGRDDVAAVRWYEAHAPRGSVLAYVAANVPDDLTAAYARTRVYGTDYIPQLADVRSLRLHGFTRRSLATIAATLRGAGARHTYLLVSPSELRYSELYGVFPRRSLERLAPLLRSSRRFRQVYRNGGASIFELR